jgi:transcriptional regulator with XRE-family HTH domain
MNLIIHLKKLMEKRKISRYRLSKETGIPYTTLTQILKGRTKDPQISALEAIADYFNVTVDYLIGESISSIVENVSQGRLAYMPTFLDTLLVTC